jgi:hypothetical protein
MFSKKYKNFTEWLKNFSGSKSYKERIIREHKNYPQASLRQLRGHPGKLQKPVSKLKPGKRRKSQNRLVVIQGNVISDDETMTAANVYFEAYVRIADRNVDKFMQRIFKKLGEGKIKLFRSDPLNDRISIGLADRDGNKIISQKKFLEKSVNEIEKNMHPAVKKTTGHHKRDRPTHEEYKRRYEDE